jgi:hypothetical protein
LTAANGADLNLQITPSYTFLPSKGTPALLIESALTLDAISKSPLTQRSIRLKRSASSVQYAILQLSSHYLYVFPIRQADFGKLFLQTWVKETPITLEGTRRFVAFHWLEPYLYGVCF